MANIFKVINRASLFAVITVFVGSVGFAQDKKATTSVPEAQPEAYEDSIVNVAKKDIERAAEVATDSAIYNLKDLAIARVKDSLWLQEVYGSSLFEEMYDFIVNENIDELEVTYEELSTEVLKQRLEELNARTPFQVEYNASLESIIKHYLKNRRKSLEQIMARSNYYFPMFEEVLDRHDLPLEIKYLAIVESALNPRAKSRMGATGLWQFMFTTGKMFGLDVSSYVDERSDPLPATEAASSYLKSLNNSFNDWNLALAAYNCGPGNVSKAIRRSGGATDYWELRRFLPRETAGYVPAFLATMYIFEYAEAHGFNTKRPDHIPYAATDTVHVKNQITLDQVATLTSLDKEELEFLNPSYKLGIIPVVDGKEYVLRLPITAVGTFVANEAAIYDHVKKELEEESLPELYDRPEKIRYRVKSGDYLGRIAQRYGVRVSQIKSWNGLRSNNLRIGQHLTIYPRNFETKVAKSSPKVESKGNEKIYTVRSGDSLWSISRKFPGVSIDNLKKWNGISGVNLKPGTKLKIKS